MRSVFAAACAWILLATAAWVAAESPSQRVRLRVLDAERARAGVQVLVNYPDGVRTSGTTLTLTTDASGRVAFDLPAKVFWVTVPSLNAKVLGKRFDVPRTPQNLVRWDIRPRTWTQEGRDQ
jgi:hypothetical protein